MKRTPLRRKSKSPLRKLQDELWELCRQIVFSDYGNVCYTCGARDLEGKNLQCGHFIPSSSCGAYLRYDIRNLRPQCYRCNIILSGNGTEYYRRMVAREGQEFVDQLFEDKQKSVQAEKRYRELIDKYSLLV